LGKLELFLHREEFITRAIAQSAVRPLEKPIPAVVLGGRISGPVLVDGEVKVALGTPEASFGITVGRSHRSGHRHVQPTKQSRGGLLVRRLKSSTADLIFLDRDEERAEITLTKTFVALALNEFEEDRADEVR
jgi:hypothetical protein